MTAAGLRILFFTQPEMVLWIYPNPLLANKMVRFLDTYKDWKEF
jgi:hypothetical protein